MNRAVRSEIVLGVGIRLNNGGRPAGGKFERASSKLGNGRGGGRKMGAGLAGGGRATGDAMVGSGCSGLCGTIVLAVLEASGEELGCGAGDDADAASDGVGDERVDAVSGCCDCEGGWSKAGAGDEVEGGDGDRTLGDGRESDSELLDDGVVSEGIR